MTEVVIDANSVAFGFRRKNVLVDFNLSVSAGESVVMLGANGAGKTTALRLLAGEISPDAGRVRVLGGDPRRAEVRRRMAFLRDYPMLLDFLTVSEWIRFQVGIQGKSAPSKSALQTILERVGLEAVAKKRTTALSKGMKRRCELAFLLSLDAPVWLLDEPGAGLDPAGTRLFREVVHEARGRGTAVLFSSHATSDAVLTADRTVILERGAAAFAGDRAALMARLGARSFVADGCQGDPTAAIRSAVEQAGGRLTGPDVPLEKLDDMVSGSGAR